MSRYDGERPLVLRVQHNILGLACCAPKVMLYSVLALVFVCVRGSLASGVLLLES